MTLGSTVPTPPTGKWNISLDGSGNLVAKKPDGSTVTLIVAGGGASKALDNLSGVAINASLLPGSSGVIDLGSSSFAWGDEYLKSGGLLKWNNAANVQMLSSGGVDNFAAFSRHLAPSAATAALAGAGAGNVDNGTRTYKVTFVTATGETDGGTASGVVTVADKTVNGKVALTAIPLGNGNVTSRKVYRTIAGNTGSYLLLTTIADNTTTTYTDNTADASLGAAAPSTNSTLDRVFLFRQVGAGQSTSGFVFPANTSFNLGGNTSFYVDTSGNLTYMSNGTYKFQNISGTMLATITQTGDVNAITSFQINGTSINAAGTLSNVAYLNQANIFAGLATVTGNLVIGSGGTAITKYLSATATLDFANLAAIGCEDLTMTVTGAAVGDTVALGVPNGSVVANGTFSAWVSAADTVTVRFCTVISGDPASGSFRASVIKH